MPPEEFPVGTFPPTEAVPDPGIKKMSLDELTELVKWPSKLEEFAEEHATPELPPAPEPIEQPPVETPVPEPAVEAAPAEPVQPAEPNQEDIDRELLRAQLEAIEAHSKKLEAKLTGREAGERGYINQLKERIRRLEAGESSEPPQEPQYRPDAPEVLPPIDGVRQWAVQKASQEAVQKFIDTHPDSNELEAETMQYLTNSGFDARHITQLDDPIAASREMTRVLDEAYWHVKEVRNRARISELQTRKADQVRGIEEAKRRAAPSASGAPPVPPAPQKTLKDLSLSELEAKMRALSGR